MTNSKLAFHQMRYLIDNTPFHVREVVAPIFTNYQSADYAAMVRTVKGIFAGTRDEHLIYEAAQYAVDLEAADDCRCGLPISEHIGHKPCVYGEKNDATSLHHLPIFGRMWREDAHELNA